MKTTATALALVLLAVHPAAPRSAAAPAPPDTELRGLLRLYRAEADPGRRAALLLRMARSRDPRAAVALGEALSDGALAVRVAATRGVTRYFLEAAVQGGTEQQMEAAARWWARNQEALRRRAGRR